MIKYTGAAQGEPRRAFYLTYWIQGDVEILTPRGIFTSRGIKLRLW